MSISETALEYAKILRETKANQVFGLSVDYDSQKNITGVCAMGAIAQAKGCNTKSEIINFVHDRLDDNELAMLHYKIIGLNDSKHLSFKEIATYLIEQYT